MPTFLPALVILSAALLAVLFILYRIYETRVEQPKKLEDEIKEALGGARPDVEFIEPKRAAAAAMAYKSNKIVIVTNFGKKPPRTYSIPDLFGMEIFVDGKIFARVVRAGSNKPFDAGSYKSIDDIAPTIHKVEVRLIFDDPANPHFNLVIWDPHDALSARAEGPVAAMANSREWFHHVEAILRRPAAKDVANLPPITPAPEPAKVAAPAPKLSAPLPSEPLPAPAPAPKPEGDVLNAPLIPYL